MKENMRRTLSVTLGLMLAGCVVAINPQRSLAQETRQQPVIGGTSPAKVAKGSSNGSVVVLDVKTREWFIQSGGKRLSISSGLRDGEVYPIRIVNVNRYKFNVLVSVAGSNLFRDVPAAFAAYDIRPKPENAAVKDASAVSILLDQAEHIRASIERVNDLGILSSGVLEGVTDGSQADTAEATINEAVTDVLNFLEDAGPYSPSGESRQSATRGAHPQEIVVHLKKILSQSPKIKEALEAALADSNSRLNEEQQKEVRDAVATLKKVSDDQIKIENTAGQAVVLVLSARSKDYLEVVRSFQVKNDIVTLSVTLTPVETGQLAPETMSVDIPTTQGFKIDFSAGLMITTLIDENFGTTPEQVTVDGQTVTRYRITKDRKDAVRFETMAMTHFYWRTQNRYQFAVTLGLVAKNDPLYGLGVSVFTGRSQRVVFTIGAVAGKTPVLKSGGVGDLIESNTAPTVSVTRIKPFSAISYNF